jgi:hypothetical protein
MDHDEISAAWNFSKMVAINIGSVTLSKEDVLAIDDFINRQKAEIERLTEIIKSYDFRDRAVFGNEAFLEQKKRTALNFKFETGDFAKIVDCRSGHNFDIGTIVKLEKCKSDYKAFAGGNWWWVTDEDLADVDEDIDNLVKEFTEGGDTE